MDHVANTLSSTNCILNSSVLTIIVPSQVAIKRLKKNFNSWEECVALRELQSLQTITTHKNIVQIKELIRENDSDLYFVFEYMADGNLYNVMKQCAFNRAKGNPNNFLNPQRIKSIMEQVLNGLDHLHAHGFSHRDIKPENLLLSGNTCKIADFGLAREARRSPFEPALTEYISTRWYRAPEILLRDPNYGTGTDIFALGCVMAELMTLKPLFPGSNEVDQIQQIFQMLGAPGPFHWPQGIELARKLNIISFLPPNSFHTDDPRIIYSRSRMNLEYAVPDASPQFINVLMKMLQIDPRERAPAREILNDSFFTNEKMSVETIYEYNPAGMEEMPFNKDHVASCSHRLSPRSVATSYI